MPCFRVRELPSGSLCSLSSPTSGVLSPPLSAVQPALLDLSGTCCLVAIPPAGVIRCLRRKPRVKVVRRVTLAPGRSGVPLERVWWCWCLARAGFPGAVRGADELADPGLVLLFTCAPSFSLPGRLGEGDVPGVAVGQQMTVNKLRAVSESIPRMGNGNTPETCSRATKTHLAALFHTDRLTVHPVQMSVTVGVKQSSPKALQHSWPTRSISTNPGARPRPNRCSYSPGPKI